jgi:hypothetical protein
MAGHCARPDSGADNGLLHQHCEDDGGPPQEIMSDDIPKSSQDLLGKLLSKWRNKRVSKGLAPPFLDIACGDNILAGRVEQGIGIDVVDYGNADVLTKDFERLPFKDESFQSIAIVASLNYFDNPERVLAECARVLKPDGALILTLLNPLIGKLWHMIREPWAKLPGFSFRYLEEMARAAGFEIVRRSRFMLGMNNLYKLKKATRPIFLVSTGRTGTKYFSKLFSTHCSGITCYHTSSFSRLLNVISNMHWQGIIPKNVMKRIWKTLKYKEIRSLSMRYIECNPNYYNLIEIISELFPDAKFIYVVRSPKAYITSHINWERQRWKSIIANRLVPFWQPMPYIEELKGFTNDYHQRVDFYSTIWERKNAHILETIAGNEHVITLRFEDIFDPQKGTDILFRLMEWLELPLVRPIDSKTVTTKQNISRTGSEDQWNEHCSQIVKRNNSGLMERFGYKE